MKKRGIGEKPHLKRKKKTPGPVRVSSGPGLTGFCRVVAPADLLTNPDRSSHRIDPPGWAEFNNCVA